jgi:hypothetical protein
LPALLKRAELPKTLPKTLGAKPIHHCVVGDQCGALDERLRGEHAVEWVAVFVCKRACF